MTALLVHLTPAGAAAASAGHPPPLLLGPAGPQVLDVPPGLPLGLETGHQDTYATVSLALPPDALLLLHTDGLGDREGARSTEPLELLTGVPHGDPPAAADAVLRAAARAGPAADDVGLMVERAGRVGTSRPG